MGGSRRESVGDFVKQRLAHRRRIVEVGQGAGQTYRPRRVVASTEPAFGAVELERPVAEAVTGHEGVGEVSSFFRVHGVQLDIFRRSVSPSQATLEGVNDSEERFDLLNESGEPTGETKARAQVHRDGDWHRTFHLWIVKDGRYVLLQRRSVRKNVAGGKVDVTVGGHFRAGEGLAQVVREAEEEIGLRVTPADLHYLGTHQSELVQGDITDREIVENYVLRCDQPLEHYYLDCAEVDVLYEAPLSGAINLYREGGFLAVAGFDCQARPNNALLVEDDLIEAARETTAQVLLNIKAWLDEQ